MRSKLNNSTINKKSFLIGPLTTNNVIYRNLLTINIRVLSKRLNPFGIYLLKVNNRNTSTRYEICSKLTIKTSERRQWRRCFHCQLWTYFTSWSSVSIVNFEQVNAGWIALSHNGYSINVANCEIFRKIRWLIFCFLTTCFANLEYLLKETRNSSKIRPLNFENQ